MTALKPLAGPVHGLVSNDALATAVPQKAATAAGGRGFWVGPAAGIAFRFK